MDLKKIFIKNASPVKTGGQAVLEGVMMKSEDRVSLAVRLPDDTMHIKTQATGKRGRWTRMPVIRGVIVFVDSLVQGTKTLMDSADILERYEGEGQLEEDRFSLWLKKIFGEKGAWNVMLYTSVILALAFTIGVFVIGPTAAVSWAHRFTDSDILLNLIEGIFRILLFVLYIVLISKMEDIKKVFQYHGAEHKSIHCMENGEELTVGNCRKYCTIHPRCGTSFLMFVMVTALILFSFLGWPDLLWRILSRLLLIPVIAGISFELLRWAGRSDSWVVKILSIPGLYLQKLTTREPEDDQMEVAIAALKAATSDIPEFGEGMCDKEGRIIKDLPEKENENRQEEDTI